MSSLETTSCNCRPADRTWDPLSADAASYVPFPSTRLAVTSFAEFIVQGHRYDIWEDIGCYPTTVNTPAAYPLSFVWPNIIALVSAVYCGRHLANVIPVSLMSFAVLTLRAFMRRRAEFKQFLSSNPTLTVNQYFRLMSLATAELLFSTPISAYGLYLNITSSPIYPWKSWSDIHFGWFTIDTFPAILWRSSTSLAVTLELSRWLVVFCAFVFFAFFGFADEAHKHYKLWYRAVAKWYGIVPASTPSSSSGAWSA